MLARKPFGTRSYEVHVGRMIENKPSCCDGISNAFDTGHAAGSKIFPIHQERIQLHTPVAREEGAPPSVESFIIFHSAYSSLNSVDGRRPTLELSIPSGEGNRDSALVGRDGIVRHGPGAAMNQEGWCDIHASQVYERNLSGAERCPRA